MIDYKIEDVKIVKANENKCGVIQDVNLIDLKLNVYGPIEDQVYAVFP
jgi:hypothetical protein